MSAHRRIIVLGSTGSIGTQTLAVIEHLNALHAKGAWALRYDVVGLAAGSNIDLLTKQAAQFGTRELALARDAPGEASLRTGTDAAERLVCDVECDIVVAAMSGAAGLPATLAAVRLGRDVALANKETLVAAGQLIVPAAQRSGSRLLPIDSEHSALWQCLAGAADHGGLPQGDGAGEAVNTPHSCTRSAAPPFHVPASVERMILTASGGPFRTWTREEIDRASPQQALKHPTWKMGPKVTVDCASLTNKGLEIIEAHWLFGIPAQRIEVLIHPQSIVHSLVEYADCSTIAQLGSPDMRGPIQYAIAFPHRPPGPARRVDWRELRHLDFEPPDHDRFPALQLAYRAIQEGGTAGAVLNAANEAAVEAFLAAQMPFGEIPRIVAAAMDHLPPTPIASLEDVEQADLAARHFVQRHLS